MSLERRPRLFGLDRAFCFRVLVALPAALYALLLVLNAGELPKEDYWAMLESIMHGPEFSTELADWFSPANEHLIPLTKLLIAFNVVITHGSNLTLCILAWFLAWGLYLLICSILPQTLSRTENLLVPMVLSLFCFSPVAYHNWMVGFSGVHWIGATFFAVLALRACHKYLQSGSGSLCMASLFFALLASGLYSSALMVWPVLLLILLLHIKSRPVGFAIFSLSAILVFALVANYTSSPVHHEAPFSAGLTKMTLFFLASLGSPFAQDLLPACILGSVGLIFLLSDLKNLRDTELLIWRALALFTILNLLLAAIFRASANFYTFTTSRYVFVIMPFWIGLFVILLKRLPDILQVVKNAVVVWAGLVSLLVLPYFSSLPNVLWYLETKEARRLGALSLELDAPDMQLVKSSLNFHFPEVTWRIVPLLKLIKHVPFDAGSVGQCPLLGQSVTALNYKINDVGKYTLRWSNSAKLSSTWSRIEGWISAVDPDLQCLIFTDQKGLVLAKAIFGVSFSGRFNQPGAAPLQNWAGYNSSALKLNELQAFLVSRRTSTLRVALN